MTDAEKYVPPGKKAAGGRGGNAGGGAGGRADEGGGVLPLTDEVRGIVEDMNRTHAFVLAGADALILREGVDAWGESEVRFVKIGAFKHLWGNHALDLGKKDPVTFADIWLTSALRRQYLGVCFAPEGDAPEDYYNLWRGFAVEPAEGDVEPFIRHVREVLAAGNDGHADHIVGWFADIVQNPGAKCETSILFRGDEGTGKTLPGRIVGSLFPAHYALIDDPRYLTGNFNVHMETCLLLQADESFWAGDKTAEGRLKGLVTSDVHFIERKGVDAYRVRNLIRLMVTSNNDWMVPAGYGSRRWAVFDAANTHKDDGDYFAELAGWWHAEGSRAALLHFLLNVDLGMIDLRRIPDTTALYEQRVSSMDVVDAWWYSRLVAGSILPGHEDWIAEVPCDALWESYVRYAEKVGEKRKRVEVQLGIAFQRRLLPRGWPKRRRAYVSVDDGFGNTIPKRKRVYVFPPLDECRAHMQALLSGHEIDWGSEGEGE